MLDSEEPDDPRLWRYTEMPQDGSLWRRDTGDFVAPFRYETTQGDGLLESLDPQWQRETYVRDADAEVADVLARKEAWLNEDLEAERVIKRVQNTTLNLQVGAGASDGYSYYNPPNTFPGSPDVFLTNSWSADPVGVHNSGTGYSYHVFHHFTGVSGLSGSTINTATIQVWGDSADQGTPQTVIGADDSDSPSAPTTGSGFDAITRTTASVTWDNCDLSTSAFTTSPSIVSVIQELADSYDTSTITIVWDNDLFTDSLNRSNPSSYDNTSAEAMKLDIDYTAGGGGSIVPIVIQQMTP